MNNKVTRIQDRINHKAGVKTATNVFDTMHIVNQVKYDKLFNADKNYTMYVPTGNESKFELLVKFNVHIAIARYRLKKYGNLNSLDLLNGQNRTVCLEDLQQEVLLKFVEHSDSWDIGFDGKVQFLNDSGMIEIFKCIDNYMYQNQTKHYKHLYVEIDGEIVDCNKVTELADYVSIEELQTNINFIMFYNRQTDTDKRWLELRLDGNSNTDISKIMNVTYKKVRCIESRIRKAWNVWNN